MNLPCTICFIRALGWNNAHLACNARWKIEWKPKVYLNKLTTIPTDIVFPTVTSANSDYLLSWAILCHFGRDADTLEIENDARNLTMRHKWNSRLHPIHVSSCVRCEFLHCFRLTTGKIRQSSILCNLPLLVFFKLFAICMSERAEWIDVLLDYWITRLCVDRFITFKRKRTKHVDNKI